MSYASHRLRYVFEGQGDQGFTAWSYTTTDPIEKVLEPGYFSCTDRTFRRGDLIWLAIETPRPSSPWSAKGTAPDLRRALLMVSTLPGRPATTRLVQDYGGPDDPSGALTYDGSPFRNDGDASNAANDDGSTGTGTGTAPKREPAARSKATSGRGRANGQPG